MANYQNIRLDKTMYKAGVPFSDQLEKLDPSAAYAGTELAGLDAFQRQLKRFDIRVSGPKSSSARAIPPPSSPNMWRAPSCRAWMRAR